MLSRLSLPHSLLVLAAGLASLTSVRGQAGSAAGKTHCSPTMHLFASAASRGSDSLSLSLFSLSSLSPWPCSLPTITAGLSLERLYQVDPTSGGPSWQVSTPTLCRLLFSEIEKDSMTSFLHLPSLPGMQRNAAHSGARYACVGV